MPPKKLIPIIVLFIILSACTRPNLPRQSEPVPTSASGPAPIQEMLSTGNHCLEITIDGLQRAYILHIPPAVNNGEPLPLIIVLHGTYGTGRKMQLGLGFDPYADSRGFYVAYPDAYQKPGERETARWNDGRGTLASSMQGIDDVKFLASLVEEIAGKSPLDKSRVFVTGASNGGMMTYRLGCETDGIFAGVAPVIGNIPQPIFDSCNPHTPLNILAINGDSDPFVPFTGGEVCGDTPSRLCEGGWVESQSASVGKFAAANGCDAVPQSASQPAKVEDGTSIKQQTYANCASGAQVTAYIVHDGGHTWPPRESQVAAGGKATANLDATPLIVNFFLGAVESSSANLPATVVYKTVEGIDPDLLSLDIHAPAGIQNAPVIIWVHGGGYVIGDKTNQVRDKIRLFNSQGWILVSVNYRLSTPEKGAVQFPDHFLDVAAAVAWVRENIPGYGGDPQHIALLGHSAGADIVSNVVVNPTYLQTYGLNLSDIACAAPLDTAGFDKVKAGSNQSAGEQEQWENALGNNPNYLTETSATLLIRPAIGIPSVLGVVRGAERRQQIETEFLAALQAAGIETTLIDARFLSHQEVNSQIGAPGDTVMTEPLINFLTGCFAP